VLLTAWETRGLSEDSRFALAALEQRLIVAVTTIAVSLSSCVYEFTLGERAFQDSRNKKARLSITDRRA
jgi:hypothetical protein